MTWVMKPALRKEACKFLMARETSSYRYFQEQHAKFLDKNPHADERKRRRRLQFIEEAGLEAALWPTLFYDDDLRPTHVRATDARRLQRMKDDGSDDEEDFDGDGLRHSTKKAYAALRSVLALAMAAPMKFSTSPMT